jgi:hypothetical protein
LKTSFIAGTTESKALGDRGETSGSVLSLGSADLSGVGSDGAESGWDALGIDPPGLTLKSNPEEEAGVGASGWVMESAPGSALGVASCANAEGGNKGTTITIKETIAVAFVRRVLSTLFILIGTWNWLAVLDGGCYHYRKHRVFVQKSCG